MGDPGKFRPIDLQEASTDGLKTGQDIAPILRELEVKGYSPAEIIYPPVRKRPEQEFLEKNQRLKAEMERQLAARKQFTKSSSQKLYLTITENCQWLQWNKGESTSTSKFIFFVMKVHVLIIKYGNGTGIRMEIDWWNWNWAWNWNSYFSIGADEWN